ncbi:MAG TPA: response regulator [Steroidobacteraceae bacterium]|nr:response regulator [Steroidobacteraceae bacterium]
MLLIEDDPSVARSIARLLRSNGYEVVSAAARDEALQHVEVHGLRPDMILTDFHLAAGIFGDEIVDEIAARLRYQPPTIMLTSIPGLCVDRVKSSVDRILAKPVDIHVLLGEIEDLLRNPA